MKRAVISFAGLLLASCGIRQPAVGPATYVEQNGSPFSVTPADGVPPEHRRALQELIDTTLAITSSKAFADHLDSLGRPYRGLWLSPWGDVLSPRQVEQIYTGRHRTVRPAPTIIVAYDTSEGPSTDLSRAAPVKAIITLPDSVIARWRSPDVTRRSCAVNTLAHELTHTISKSDRTGDGVFEDGWGLAISRAVRRHVVSYTVGGVAQCTMLENHHQPLDGGFEGCLRRWGRSPFPALECGGSGPA